MEELKITKIFFSDKDKQGNPLINRTGYHYTRLTFQAEEQRGPVWISGFQNEENKNWKVNDLVRVIITEKASPSGGVYLNFRIPDKVDLLESRMESLEKFVKGDKKPEKEFTEQELAEPEIPESELPF